MKRLAACISVPLAVGSVVGKAISKDVKAYSELDKPGFAPPKWAFPVAWTTLYTLMGVAKYKALEAADEDEKKGIMEADGLQLSLNFIWSFLFFKFHLRGAALIEMTTLLLAILYTAREYAKVSKTAAKLLLPYILWVSFALCLNASVWYKNK
ncbi:TspO/MBR family protein [Eubacterium sp. 1001713B170207_170306_E7]|uniref:TspO/MBR family protein n=1 Tax=Eubacterium sp. 1001713B170207_170306_E7 TaxID=2787097 RepID=UPI001A9BACC9|nr:TspO/MBR family protein [Eubacterium sp. 1001713B170207_170306_E7]